MIKGKVVSQIWATKRIDTLPQGAFLEIEVSDGNSLVAFDPLGCGENEEVLVVQGSVAASYFEGTRPPVDALVIGSVDERS